MNITVKKIMNCLIGSDKSIHIKLLGDSITHGEGGTGFKQNGKKIIDGFSRNDDGYCWANLFKEHMESQYNCKVINNACTGTTIEFIIQNFNKLVDIEDDVVICAIGTNNRNQFFENSPKRSKEEHMKDFYDNLVKLNNMFKEAEKEVIFIANIPASAENEKDGVFYWRIFHMNDLNDIYMKASADCNFPFISLYSLFIEYCSLKNISVESLLADGIHPNDRGHDIIFQILIEEFGLRRK